MKDTDIAWLAGLLEGEGSFFLERNVQYNKSTGKKYERDVPLIALRMVDEDVIIKAASIMDADVFAIALKGKYRKGISVMFKKKQKENYQDTYSVRATGKRAVAVMEKILPYMGERRRAKIEEILKRYYKPFNEIDFSDL